MPTVRPQVLPAQPDFATLDLAAPGTADRRTLIPAHIGNLVFAWSNNETLLIYLIGILMRTNEVAAAIVFAILNTSRARRRANEMPHAASAFRYEGRNCRIVSDARGRLPRSRALSRPRQGCDALWARPLLAEYGLVARSFRVGGFRAEALSPERAGRIDTARRPVSAGIACGRPTLGRGNS